MKKNFIVFLHADMSVSFEQIWGRPISFCFRLSHLFPTLLCLLPKTLENLAGFYCFQGVKKGCIGNKWIKFERLPMNFQLLFLLSRTRSTKIYRSDSCVYMAPVYILLDYLSTTAWQATSAINLRNMKG